MKFNDNPSGLISFLIGCIIVVMAGVGISLLVDRRFGFSSNEAQLQRDLATGETELDQLQGTCRQLAPQVAASVANGQRLDGDRQALIRQLRASNQRRDLLEASRNALKPAIRVLDEEFSHYRQRYREMVRAAAVGESLGDLKIRAGREFRKATIVRVTDVGLEIHHEEGSARVQAPDLGDALRERFQWNDEERYARLREESTQTAADPPATAAATKLSTPPQTEPAKPDPDKLRILRRRVIAAKAQVGQLVTQSNEAVSKATFGREHSVPGSLETWQNRAKRLAADLERARLELAAARALLSDLSPGDDLLVH